MNLWRKKNMTPAGSGPPRYGGLKSTNGCIYGIPQNASGVSWRPMHDVNNWLQYIPDGSLIIFNWCLKIAYRLLLAYRHYIDGFGLCCICVCNCMHICIIKGWNLGHCFESLITCPNQCAEESLVNAWWLQLAAESGTLVQLPCVCVYSKQWWEPGYSKSHDF